ncbi:MAG TPA: TlpA disulfide reductase family protein [Acidimicrobiia bacterium]|nr:TlpA disulfide reductase family protein [Acidimicrobiia bacterium]
MRTLRRQSDHGLPDLIEPEALVPRRRRWGWWLLAAVVLVGAAGAVAVTTDDSLSKVPGTSRLTGAAKTFSLDDVRPGRPVVSLEALRGRPVVLNFFGSWCPPCVRELPALEAMSQRYRGRIAFVGVTFNDGREEARGLLDRAGVTYPAAFDAKSDLAYDYGIRGMPTTVFISPDGNLIEGKKGEFSEVQLRTTIDRLFGSTSDSPSP